MMSSKLKIKKEKTKISKHLENSDSDDTDNEHELSHYMNDRVKLMKQVLKIIKPKKIKSMAPDCIKHLDIEELNSMLLEELLGISNKRLKYIFNGQNLEEDSSSTDPEEEKQPIDIISLDDVSDDDFIIVDSDSSKKGKQADSGHKRKKVKKEKLDKTPDKGKSKKGKTTEDNLMSVLELLELQARARAIRSQLLLESSKKNEETSEAKEDNKKSDDDDEDAVIIEIPKNDEIVITSSESENDSEQKGNDLQKKGKIKLVRDRLNKKKLNESSEGVIINAILNNNETPVNDSNKPTEGDSENINPSELQKGSDELENKETKNGEDSKAAVSQDPQSTEIIENDTIVINVDEDEMDCIIRE